MRTRRKVTVAATATVLAAYGVALTFAAPSASAAPVFAVTPYVDMTNNAEGMLDTAIRTAGVNSYTASFITGVGCTPLWGVGQNINVSEVSAKIARAERAGARTIIAFGGAAGAELAQSCTSTASLTRAYQSVIDKYHVTHLDFDIEGAAIADTGSIKRRYQAINALLARNRGLVISVTIPVLENGPDFFGEAFLRAARTNGTRISIVNAMAMDYGHPVSNMGAAAVSAARGTLAAARRAGLNFSLRNIGITPMIGQNDTPREIFTLANASTVISFANGNGIGRLAFWSINRDQACAGGPGGPASPICSSIRQSSLQFTRMFTGFRGSPPPPPPPPPPAPTGTSPPPSPSTWAPGVHYAIGAVVTFQGARFRCIQAHTSQVGWEPPIVPALWQRL